MIPQLIRAGRRWVADRVQIEAMMRSYILDNCLHTSSVGDPRLFQTIRFFILAPNRRFAGTSPNRNMHSCCRASSSSCLSLMRLKIPPGFCVLPLAPASVNSYKGVPHRERKPYFNKSCFANSCAGTSMQNKNLLWHGCS